jgi:hypothetical protein
MQGFENSEHRSQSLPVAVPLRIVARTDETAALTQALRRMLESCPVPPELLARVETACAGETLRDAS